MPRPSGAGATRQPCLSRGIGEAGPDFWVVRELSVAGAVLSASGGVPLIMVQRLQAPRPGGGRYAAAVPSGDERAPRKGPFWDVLEGRRDPPPAAVLLGFRLISVDPEAGTIEVAFDAGEKFLNPGRADPGRVPGGDAR